MQNLLKQKNISQNKGFSLVEVVIALFILSFGISVIILLATTNIRSTLDAKNELVAMGLAQEGMELIRNIKDNDAQATPATPWNSLVVDGTSEKYNCRIGFNDSAWSVSLNSFCNSSATNNSTNFYSLYNKSNTYSSDNSGTITNFARRVAIRMQDSTGNTTNSFATAFRIRVRVIVTWDKSYPDDTKCTVANKCIFLDSYLTK